MSRPDWYIPPLNPLAVVRRDADGSTHQVADCGSEEVARMVAALPELVEALTAAVARCEDDDEVWLNQIWTKAALAALRKAGLR